MRALAASREPAERRAEALEGDLERKRKEVTDLVGELARSRAAVSASEQQVQAAAFPVLAAAHPEATSRTHAANGTPHAHVWQTGGEIRRPTR